ncbi:MAG: twin-arginine translocase TatA/TatE family subunit [Novosphingopyxis baekryungensis]|jgi:sec-independent protein translocase protein TatA|uniref:twin-arginine translocase TatA/TatE family subunit n=1 Tax=Novosphingopyxis baekryungensis TaxID=279369 RepID=UPI00041BD028|nr:twin-arginine translocase TatA/TatE family subunit [Novosphingopyxis baekryungensis]MDE0933705.1 twin-arginine translocase TatA/TatE family subunit [Novosphingopyxis baekryungensis]
MQPSIWQLLIVAALVLILFGRGRISEMMGDVGKGIKSFKKGITDEDHDRARDKETPAEPPRRIEGTPPPVDATRESERDRDHLAN